MLDVTFVDMMTKLQSNYPSVKGFILLTDRDHMPQNCKLRNVMCYEDLLEVWIILLVVPAALLFAMVVLYSVSSVGFTPYRLCHSEISIQHTQSFQLSITAAL